ncbi:MAG: YlbF family regulator [Anaerovoracaceae bacterium]|nr:YlbF family regulator [Anaerovoracaceae bacterium]
MNVYDEAHNLQTAIKESEEFRRFDAARQKLEQNPELKSMMDDFMKKQMDVQAKQVLGEEVGQEATAAMQELMGILNQDPVAAEYLQCSMRLSIMMKDVYEIIGEVMGGSGQMP